MGRIHVMALLLLALGVVLSVEARSFYCNGRIVQVGDPIFQVGRACPEPFWREHYDVPLARDPDGRPIGWERVEVWTLNFGDRRLMRRLVFSDGRLTRTETLGYGVRWRPGSRSCTWHELENAGNTMAEIYARCGEPDHRYDLSVPGPYGFAGPYGSGQQRERWTYDFGPRQHARQLEFVNGRLQRIDTLRR